MKIEFIIPTYSRTDLLMTCISSIVGQTNPNWTIHVVADCPPEEEQLKIANIAAYYQFDDRIKFSVLQQRYNDWGHTPRQFGLDYATEEWVVMTGEDNYYAPTFVENFLSVVRDDVNFVFCNMVHNWVKDDYIPISCEIEYGKIDIGNFMTRTFNAQKLRLKKDIEQADYYFVEEYLARFNEAQIIKIDKILYVHN
jgi:glycosyltransferase involved in cell wall biosynthesis